jgi:hypothetical protein
MPLSDGLIYATDFQFDTLTITSSSGQQVDINMILRELVIFEDLFGNAMTGSVFLSDSQDLINMLPIVGGEYLSVTLVKPSSTLKIQKVFRIYKITNRKKVTASSEDYILHFCSEEVALNESILISESYKGLTISSMVKDIASRYLKIDSTKFPLTATTETVGNFDILIPNWTPFRSINWLARMARTSTAPGCSFLFFEDNVGFHFTSLELLSQQEPVQIINFMPLNLSGETQEKSEKPDLQMRMESAEDYELSQSPDLLRAISTGTYASKLMRVNILDQEIKTSTLNGMDFFQKTKHTNKNTFMQARRDRMNIPQTQRTDAFYRIAVDNLKVETWLLQRNAYFSGLHGFQLKVSIPGNMNLRVGQIVTLNLPAATVPKENTKPSDKLYSGKYLITAIQHKIDRNKYVCILELSKDSVESQLPGAIEGSPAIDKLRKA